MEDRTTLITVTAALYIVTGLGYSVGNIPFTAHVIRTRTLPTFAGIRFFSGGFLERLGIDWVIAAGLLLVLIGFAFLPVAYLLWNSNKLGGVLALALFPPTMAVFIGSAAPIPILLEPIKIVLVLMAWSSLH